MELVKVKTPDEYTIYGLLNKSEKSRKLVVLVHGLRSGYHSYIMREALVDFAKNGFDAIAINLYDWRKGARRDTEATTLDNASDISTIVNYYRAKYDEIYLVGHSLGAIGIMVANLDNISAVSLWDPSFNFARFHKKEKYISISDKFIWSGAGLVVAKPVLDDFISYDEERCLKLSEEFKSKVQVITADADENVVFNKDKYSYHSRCKFENERIFIKGADHNFVENDSYEKLIKNTIRWFDKK